MAEVGRLPRSADIGSRVVKQARRLKKLDVLLGLEMTARERDDQALSWLAKELESGTQGTMWPLTREPWGVILMRRLADAYPRVTSMRQTWMYRHFHVRQAYCDESAIESAEHVTGIWKGSLKNSTIRTQARRQVCRDEALQWIRSTLAHTKRTLPADAAGNLNEALIYEMMDRAIAQKAREFPTKKKRKTR